MYIRLLTACMLFAFVGVACSPATTPTPLPPTPDAKATEQRIAQNIFATLTASAPTPTPVPSPTSTSYGALFNESPENAAGVESWIERIATRPWFESSEVYFDSVNRYWEIAFEVDRTVKWDISLLHTIRAVSCNVSYRMFTSNLPINSLRIVIRGGNKLLFASSFGSMLGSRIDWSSYSCRDFETLQKLGGEDAAKDRSTSQTSEAHSISWDTDIFRYELEPRSPEALPQELQNCVSWTQGQTYLDKTVCIEGVVKYATSDGYQSYLFFTNNPIEFVVVSFDYSFPSVEGKCIRALGSILLIDGTPALILESPKQLAFCK